MFIHTRFLILLATVTVVALASRATKGGYYKYPYHYYRYPYHPNTYSRHTVTNHKTYLKGKLGEAGADPGFFAGGGVNDGRVQRAPSAPAPTGGLGLINIRLRYIASIEYSERFFFLIFFAIVCCKKKLVVVESRGGHDPPPPTPTGSAPGEDFFRTTLRYNLDQGFSTWGTRTPGGTRRVIRGYAGSLLPFEKKNLS